MRSTCLQLVYPLFEGNVTSEWNLCFIHKVVGVIVVTNNNDHEMKKLISENLMYLLITRC